MSERPKMVSSAALFASGRSCSVCAAKCAEYGWPLSLVRRADCYHPDDISSETPLPECRVLCSSCWRAVVYLQEGKR